MSSFLWLWTPGGKPLHVLIDEGAELTMGRGEDGRDVAILTTTTGPPIRCELDPAHDWLPRRVTLVGSVDFFATRFARDNGVWMPVEGWERQVQQRPGVANHRGFRVTGLSINRPLTSSTFTPPEGEGVLIHDETTGRTRIPGGKSARDRLLVEHGRAATSPAGSAPVTAPRDPPTTPWGTIVASIAAVVLAVAAFLKIRPLRSKDG